MMDSQWIHNFHKISFLNLKCYPKVTQKTLLLIKFPKLQQFFVSSKTIQNQIKFGWCIRIFLSICSHEDMRMYCILCFDHVLLLIWKCFDDAHTCRRVHEHKRMHTEKLHRCNTFFVPHSLMNIERYDGSDVM